MRAHRWGWCGRCRSPGSGCRCWECSTRTRPGRWPAACWCAAGQRLRLASRCRSPCCWRAGQTRRRRSCAGTCSQYGSLDRERCKGTWTIRSLARLLPCSRSRYTRRWCESPPFGSRAPAERWPAAGPCTRPLEDRQNGSKMWSNKHIMVFFLSGEPS